MILIFMAIFCFQCSEGFMHTRMRRRVDTLIQVILNYFIFVASDSGVGPIICSYWLRFAKASDSFCLFPDSPKKNVLVNK